MSAGRPSTYTNEMASLICKKVALGSNINVICQEKGFPCEDTIYEWLKKYPEFTEEYTRARICRADARSDRIDTIKDLCLIGKIPPDVARVAVDVEKWQAGKESPRYADKQSVDVNHKGTVGIITADLPRLCELLTELATRRENTALSGDVLDGSLLSAPVRIE